jgi:alkylglycerol monooxygenase
MDINLITLAVPLFLLSMAMEYLFSIRHKQQIYHLNDFANNISCGILEQVSLLPLKGLLLLSYEVLYHQWALFVIQPQKFWTWIVLWVAVDFLYYWFHRASHRNNFLWAGHSVHHQSEQYNLSVALRQGIIQTLCSWVVYLPLAVLGFPTWMFLIISSLNTIYQFWIHTQLIKRLGWFEIFFNTPSHHRVHHGKNSQYIDKNYGGSLIIWDKLFGTFTQETIPAEYGVISPLTSWNPFYANIKVIYETWRHSHYFSSWKERMQAFLMPPEWIVKKIEPPPMPSQLSKQPKPIYYPTAYILLNLGLCVITYSYYSYTFAPYSLLSWVVGLFILLTLYLIGLILNGRVGINIKYAELFRGILILITIHALFKTYWLDGLAMSLFCISLSCYRKPSIC